MNLAVIGLKAHVLGRIEELEARERERKQLRAKLGPALEERGCDTGAVKAVMGGKAGRLNAYLRSMLKPSANTVQSLALGAVYLPNM